MATKTIAGGRPPGPSRRAVLQGIGGALALGASGLLLDACTGGKGKATSSANVSGSGKPKKGGTLRVAVTGGGSADTLDGQGGITPIDFTRIFSMYNGLFEMGADGKVLNMLAEELTPNKDATDYVLRLRKGVTWHNGKSLTVDDVIYSLRRIADPKNPLQGVALLNQIDMKGLQKVDDLTLKIHCKTPFSTLAGNLANEYALIVPENYDPKRPVGTGAFKIDSFVPGKQSTMSRFADYWEDGLPYLDELVIFDYADEPSLLNGLIAGQVDAITGLSAQSLAQLRGSSSVTPLISKTGEMVPFTMRTDKPPFSDNRVRQAMRWIVDRDVMLKQVFAGEGNVANDLFGAYEVGFDSAIPQRHQDIDRAKSLLRSAGASGLTVQLDTTDMAPGAIEMAEVFAQQASSAGVNVNIRRYNSTDFYAQGNYLEFDFAMDYWTLVPYYSQVASIMLPTSYNNQCHWNNPQYVSLYLEALKSIDVQKRIEITHEMQQIEYDEGGLMIPVNPPAIDGLRNNVRGALPSVIGFGLTDYRFKGYWLE